MVTVHVPWSSKAGSIPVWDQITISIIERFGLPGDKYTTELTDSYMNFLFKDEREGLVCQLLVSDYI